MLGHGSSVEKARDGLFLHEGEPQRIQDGILDAPETRKKEVDR